MNEIYIKINEISNAMRNLCSILNLDSSSSLNVCLLTISNLMEAYKKMKGNFKEKEPQGPSVYQLIAERLVKVMGKDKELLEESCQRYELILNLIVIFGP